MKKWAMILVAVVAATTFAACGGDNHGHNDGDDDNHAHDGDDHDGGHGHEHSDAEELGTDSKDGYEIDVDLAIDKKNPLDGAIMVAVKKDGKVVKGLSVTVSIVDKDGKVVGEVSEEGEFEADEGHYDCHIILPKEHEGKFVKVTLRDGDKKIEFKLMEL